MRRISWGGGGQEVKTGKGGERNKGETGERGPSCLLVRLLLSTLLAVLAVTSSFCLQCYRVTAGSDRPSASAASDSALNFNPGTGIPKILLFLRNSVFLSFAASPSLQHPRGTSAVRADLSEKLLLRCSR